MAEFTKAVLRPRILAGYEWVTQARTRQQALDELSTLRKTLYEKSLGALVERINRALDHPFSKSTFIDVLDIADFEIFEVNAHEQLLINYTNERLRQSFNHHMFELGQEEYARECIEWDLPRGAPLGLPFPRPPPLPLPCPSTGGRDRLSYLLCDGAFRSVFAAGRADASSLSASRAASLLIVAPSS